MSTTGWSLDKWAATHAPLDDVQRSSCTRLFTWQHRHPSVWHQSLPLGPASRLDQQQQQHTKDDDGDDYEYDDRYEDDDDQQQPDTQAVVVQQVRPLATLTLSLPDQATTSESLTAWLHSLRAHKRRAREAALQSSLTNVSQARSWTDAVLATATSAHEQIQRLSQLSTDVRTSTTPIRASSSAAVDALDRLASLSVALAERKAYFDLLTPITRLLSSPSPDLALVSSPEFQAVWTKIDQGWQFTFDHPQYAESARYKMLFEHSAVRAASLVRMWLARYVASWTDHAVRTLSNSPGEKAEMLSTPSVQRAVFGAEETQTALVRSLFKHLEDRTSSSSVGLESTTTTTTTTSIPDKKLQQSNKVVIAEIQTILDECHTTLFSARGAFLTPVFAALLGDVASNAPSPAAGAAAGALPASSSSSSSPANTIATTTQRRTSTDMRLAALWAIVHTATQVVQYESNAVRSLLDVDRAQQAYDAHLATIFDVNVSRATKSAVQTIVPPGKTSAEEVLRTLVPFLRSLASFDSTVPTDDQQHHHHHHYRQGTERTDHHQHQRRQVQLHVYQPAMDSVRSVVVRALEGKVRAIAAYVPRPGDLAYPERILRTRSCSGQTLSKKDSPSTLLTVSASAGGNHARGPSIGGSGVLDAATTVSSSSPSSSSSCPSSSSSPSSLLKKN